MGDNLTAPARITFDHWGYRHASRARFAVRDLSLDIPAGQRVLLLGSSGLGKSTIMEGICGLIGSSAAQDGAGEDEEGGITEGAILIDGIPAKEAHGRAGLVLQDPEAQAVFARFGDNVAFGPENLGVPRDEIWPRVRASLDAVGLGDIQLHRSVMHLSGGQMQRLALAGALAMRPGALLLDEPTANLDPEGVGQVVAAVRGVLEAQGSTMILVEHRAAPWMDLIDRVIVLARGDDGQAMDEGGAPTRIVADGTPDEVFSNPDIDFDALGVWVPPQYPAAARQRMPRVAPAPAAATSADTEPILSTRGLAIGRDGHAIAGPIDLDFHAGEITALVGPNGAGKSTMSLTLAGLLEPVAGRVEASAALARGIKGGSREPHRWTSPELASRISYVFQNPEHQFAKGTVLDEVMVAPLHAGLGEEESRRRAEALLERLGLARYAKANPYTLSGGEKRRLTVASALACAPGVLLLDEPTFGQDRTTWASMIELIGRLRADGTCVIIVTHDEELVAALGARVIRFGEGGWRGGAEVVADDTAQDDTAQMRAVSAHASNKRNPVERVASSASDDAVSDVAAQTNHGDDYRNGDGRGDTAASRSNAETASAHDPAEHTPIGSTPDGSAPAGSAPAESAPIEHIAVTPAAERTEAPKEASRSRLLATINPGFRFLGAFLVGLPMLVSLDPVSSGIMVAALFVIFGMLGITPWRLVRSSWPVWIGAPGSAVAIILYGRVGGELYWKWGLIQVSELSVRLGLATMLRVIAIGVPAVILLLGIDPTDLADSFSENFHLPERFVYGGLAGMRLFSVLQDDWAALTASRRSRGLGNESRLRAAVPQAFALLVLSIRRSSTLATAMEARGFGGDLPRTHARESVVRARDWVFLALCVALPVASLLVAVATGDFALFGDRVTSIK